MVFSANPLAISVSDPAFESWLRDGGYLEIVDQRTSELSRHTPPPSSAGTSSADADDVSSPGPFFVLPVFTHLWALLSLFALNPFAKLTTEDFSGETPPWTVGFIGLWSSYSFPSSPSQARLRVHENVKRYARNYASLFILFFACSLYQMPLALIGFLSSLGLWDAFRLCSDQWELHKHPAMKQVLERIVQCVTVVILFFSKVQMALFCTLAASYTAMLLHAACRKLTPMKLPNRGRSN